MLSCDGSSLFRKIWIQLVDKFWIIKYSDTVDLIFQLILSTHIIFIYILLISKKIFTILYILSKIKPEYRSHLSYCSSAPNVKVFVGNYS
jgi:hypothetical protein